MGISTPICPLLTISRTLHAQGLDKEVLSPQTVSWNSDRSKLSVSINASLENLPLLHNPSCPGFVLPALALLMSLIGIESYGAYFFGLLQLDSLQLMSNYHCRLNKQSNITVSCHV